MRPSEHGTLQQRLLNSHLVPGIVTQASSIRYIEFTPIYHVTVDSIALRDRNKGSLPDETRCDADNVNEDGGQAAGGKDDSKYDAARWSTSFVNC